MPYLSLTIAIIAGALGNILIKIGSKGLSENPLAILSSPLSLLGIAFLVASFPFYSQVLQRLPLSLAFPLVTSATFILVAGASVFVFKEPLTFTHFLGMLLVIAGLFLVAQR
ncbi:cation transporter [Candidatus Uhrbacteria bacterium]|nr:cation transporter [Candidatus Uhrbacteria bacterium]